MLRIYKTFLLTAFFITIANVLFAQEPAVSINPALQEIYNSKTPKKYILAGIEVIGCRTFDKNLIVSVSSLAIGDVINIPGSDAFSKAILKLWKQNMISSAEINITKLVENNIYIEIIITERPRLNDFNFKFFHCRTRAHEFH